MIQWINVKKKSKQDFVKDILGANLLYKLIPYQLLQELIVKFKFWNK